jgi:hypothetical protein
MTPLRPPDRRSWSPRAPEPPCRLPTLAARVSRDRCHRRSHPCLAWQLPSERAAPHGAPLPLTRRGHRRSPASRPRVAAAHPPHCPVVARPVDQGVAATAPLNLRTVAVTPDRGTVAAAHPDREPPPLRLRSGSHHCPGVRHCVFDLGGIVTAPGVRRCACCRATVVVARALRHPLVIGSTWF